MDYTFTEAGGQLKFEESADFLKIPSTLHGFHNHSTDVGTADSGRMVFLFRGTLDTECQDRVCRKCGGRTHSNGGHDITLRHLPFGASPSSVRFPRMQFLCTRCGATHMQSVPFKAAGHMLTEGLLNYAEDLLSSGTYSNKQVAEITGLGKNTVKEIDFARLKNKYEDGGGSLRKPTGPSRFLGVDEFKLHDGYKYATHITDLETGHILWIAEGKKKQVVYDFIEHVGDGWMRGVEAVACDMNSDFQQAFQDRCPWIEIVFDHFHLVKNFNEKVIGEVRKDEQKRLEESGNAAAAASLKRTKYILTSSKALLESKGQMERYSKLLDENKLLFTADLIKEKLADAYLSADEGKMRSTMQEIVDTCLATKNRHFGWFARLVSSHLDGIVAHAKFSISTGKMEGINNRIKTLRRQGYGYPDDKYFFLKLYDMSRSGYVRNPKSHKFCD